METKNSKQLKCDSCGQEDYFEFNHDGSYVMCMYCHRAYKGGYEELSRLAINKTSSLMLDNTLLLK